MKVTAVKFKKNPFDALKQIQAIQNGLRATAEGAKVDFQVTTQTWNHQPTFNIQVSRTEARVWTEDETYGWVTHGTPAHIIRPRTKKRLVFKGGKYSAKTSPGVIRSRSGGTSSGKIVFARVTHHPGVKARNFHKVIQKKWEKQFPITMQRMINAALK